MSIMVTLSKGMLNTELLMICLTNIINNLYCNVSDFQTRIRAGAGILPGSSERGGLLSISWGGI
jgi:hypothetical protein